MIEYLSREELIELKPQITKLKLMDAEEITIIVDPENVFPEEEGEGEKRSVHAFYKDSLNMVVEKADIKEVSKKVNARLEKLNNELLNRLENEGKIIKENYYICDRCNNVRHNDNFNELFECCNQCYEEHKYINR